MSWKIALGLVSVLAVTAMTGTAWASGDATAVTCPNEAWTGFRLQLPDCRAYEMPSPSYKKGFTIFDPSAIASTGERVIATSPGGFAGVDNDNALAPSVYEFARSGAGWQPIALTPPAAQFPGSKPLGASTDLLRSLWITTAEHGAALNYLHLRDIAPDSSVVDQEVGALEPGSGQEDAVDFGASNDMDHVIFGLRGTARWSGDNSIAGLSLYEYSGACGTPGQCESAEPRLVGVSNEGRLEGNPVNQNAHLISQCGTELGAAGNDYNAISGDGRTIFFTAAPGGCLNSENETGAGPAVTELYARTQDGTRTVAISEPSKTDCEACNTTSELKDALFEGASEDGSKAFFVTEQELLPGQQGLNLYEYDFGAEAGHRIVLVSAGSQHPELQGIARISQDGSRVYFVAKEVLTPAKNSQGDEAQAGADNLYVFDTRDRTLRFIARLLNESEEAAIRTAEEEEQSKIQQKAFEAAIAVFNQVYKEVLAETGNESLASSEAIEQAFKVLAEEEEKLQGTLGPRNALAEDKKVWQSADERPVQANACGQPGESGCEPGRFLAFVSSADLTHEGSEMVPQIFRYDARSGDIVRASIGQNGFNGNGLVQAADDRPVLRSPSYLVGEGQPTLTKTNDALAVTNGGDVFFQSADGLAPGASNNVALGRGFSSEPPYAQNVYEYQSGDVYLLSDGTDLAVSAATGLSAVKFFGVDASGADAFFSTADSLVPSDTDTQIDLYDARIGGGFPPAPAANCEGDGCQGALATGLQAPAPAGSSLAAPEAQTQPSVHKAKQRSRHKPKRRRHKRRRRSKHIRSKGRRR